MARWLPTKADPYLALRGRISFFSEIEVEGQRYYEVRHPDSITSGGTRFAIEKPPETFRIFVLGGSAAAGWPHPSDQTFSAYLEADFARTERSVEVLNVAGHGFASYRVRHVFEDVLEFDPDLLVLWSGNNELFEERTYPRLLGPHSFVWRSHLVRALRQLAPLDSFDGRRGDNARARHAASTKILRQPHRMRADPATFQSVKDHYAFSIGAMLDAANDKGVPVLLLTVPVNLRDWWPNVSYHGLSDPEASRWKEIFDRGQMQLQTRKSTAAIAQFEQALALAPEHAHTHFLLARALEKSGDEQRAAEHYQRASDLDYSPIRAHSDLNETLRKLAANRRGVTLVDLDQIFQQHAERAAPGFDLFLDYVHPTRNGNVLAASHVFETVRKLRLVDPGADSPSPLDIASSYSESDDSNLQARIFLVALAMHQHEAVELLGAPLLERLQANPALGGLPAFRRHGLTAKTLGAMVEQNRWHRKMERRRLLGRPYRADYEARYVQMLVDVFGRFGVIEDPASAGMGRAVE